MRQNHLKPLLMAVAMIAVGASYALAQSGPPTVIYPSSSALSDPLADAPADRGAPAGGLKVKAHRYFHKREIKGEGADPALQKSAGRKFGGVEQPNFPGLGENGSIPPDPNIAVGPNQIVQAVNTDIAVFDKNGNIYAGYPKLLGSVWTALGGACATNNAGDPIVQYDRLADRWLIAQLGSLSAPYSECIAVSQTSDPTGAYYLYSYSFGSNLNDYEKIGVWPTATNPAYLATYNLFANGSSFVGGELCAYDRTAMLSGGTAAAVCYTISGDGGYLPADLDGAAAPLDGTPGIFLNFETSTTLRMYKIAPDFANPSNSTLSAASDIGVASFSEGCGGGTCVPQPGTNRQLDSLGDRLMYRLAYRRFGTDHESIVVDHSVTAGSSVGARWYELRETPPATAAAYSIYQQGTFAPDSAYRWMGSIASDQAGDLALGYSESSGSIYPSVAYTGRTPLDALNTMEAETIMQPGAGSQTGYTRWGDYTAMRIDPSDDCTFWYVNEYYTATSSYAWSTMIGSFKFPSCSGAADFSLSASASPLTFTQGTGGTSNGSVTVTSINAFNSAVALTAAGSCGTNSIACTLNPTSVTPPANGSANAALTIAVGTGTAAGSYPITVNGASGALNHSTTLTVVVSAPAPDFTLGASPSSLTIKRGSSGKYTIATAAAGGSSSISLSVSGLPARTSGSFKPNPVTAGSNSTLTVSPNRKASPGTSTLTITGNNGSYTHTAQVTLTIQ